MNINKNYSVSGEASIAATTANEMRTVKNYLTKDEFMLFYNYQLDELHKELELAKDIFCFQCATSLKYNDLEALCKSCFDNPGDPTLFTFVCKKTGENITINLNEWSKSIYMKYKDMPTQNGLLFPPKSECEMNRCLKKIAKILWGDHRLDAINTHTARRTFFVHFAETGQMNEWART